MMAKHVKLIIQHDGSCTLDAINFADATCTQATQQILNALAAQVTAEWHKPEATCLPPQVNRVPEGNG